MELACPFLLAQSSADPAASLPGINGILGTRGSLMMDIVVLSMLAVVPLMSWSIYLVRSRQRYQLHKQIQVALGLVLLIAVTLFEIDIQYVSKWEARAEASPYYSLDQEWSSPVGISLIVHLLFAVPTAVLWIYVIVQGLRRFPNPPIPSDYSRAHARWAWPAAIGMCLTAVTGWLFYWLAFVA